jgi:hypothetical protein
VSSKNRIDESGLHRLYHLPNDAGETKDLSAEQPERLKEMIAKLDEVIAAGRSRL